MKDGVPYGDYVLLGKLSQGGMAEIFLARSQDPEGRGRLFAVKRTLPGYGDDPEFISMFMDELQISASLIHPNIVRVHQTGKHGDQLFLAMEFLHGKDLRMINHRLVKKGARFPPRLAASILGKIALALDYAHSHSDPETGEALEIVHRDVNPQNIIVSYQGVPKLIDFGIAKAKDRISKTRVGVLKGKFSYLSPEQVLGEAVDGRSDVYALGVVLYRLLTGVCPFEADTEPALLLKISQGDYELPEVVDKEAPKALCEVVSRALEKDPTRRYQSAGELADDLEEFLSEGDPVSDLELAAFLKELFASQYERELAQLRKYTTLADPESDVSVEEESIGGETSRGTGEAPVGTVSALAAGYEVSSGRHVVSTPGTQAPPSDRQPDAGRGRKSAPAAPEAYVIGDPSGLFPEGDLDRTGEYTLLESQGDAAPLLYDENVETISEPLLPRRSGFRLSKAELLALGVALLIGLGTLGVAYQLSVVKRGGPHVPEKTKVKEILPANTPTEDPS